MSLVWVFCLTVHYLIDHTLKLQKKMSLFGYWARVLYCKLQIPVIKKWMDVTWMLFYFFHYDLFIINVSELILNYCSELLKIWRTIYAFFICIAAVLFFFLCLNFLNTSNKYSWDLKYLSVQLCITEWGKTFWYFNAAQWQIGVLLKNDKNGNLCSHHTARTHNLES